MTSESAHFGWAVSYFYQLESFIPLYMELYLLIVWFLSIFPLVWNFMNAAQAAVVKIKYTVTAASGNLGPVLVCISSQSSPASLSGSRWSHQTAVWPQKTPLEFFPSNLTVFLNCLPKSCLTRLLLWCIKLHMGVILKRPSSSKKDRGGWQFECSYWLCEKITLNIIHGKIWWCQLQSEPFQTLFKC